MLLRAALGILFLIYVRPQEWRPWIASFYPVYVMVAIGAVGLFQQMKGKVTLKQFFQTPHDWFILAFHAWICYADWEPFSVTFQQVRVYLIFYFLITQALQKVEDIEKFLKWWAALALFISVLALVSTRGFDPLGGRDIVEGPMGGRLLLNLSIFNNPNALGHSLVPLVPMLFYLLWWRRPYSWRLFWPILSILPLWVLYEARSRGSFVCCGVIIVMGLIFGRTPLIQIAVVLAMMSLGPGLLTYLPRMDTMTAIKKDAGVTGRMIAFEWALHKFESEPKGVGFLKFLPAILREKHYLKDAHSTFVLIGAELGFRGLFLFVGILYCCLRTVAMGVAADDREERIRRVMFVWITAYCFSSWMINYSYHPVFLVIVAVIAALHRVFRQRAVQSVEIARLPEPEKVVQRPLLALPGVASQPALALPTASLATYAPAGPWSQPSPAGAAAAATWRITGPESLAAAARAEAARELTALKETARTWPARVGIRWRRIGVVDLVLIYCATEVVVRMWKYILYQYHGF